MADTSQGELLRAMCRSGTRRLTNKSLRRGFRIFCSVAGVDFSPDSTQLVVASRWTTTSTWDLGTHKQVQTFTHDLIEVTAAKYLPEGDRIATATRGDFVRVYDTKSGRLLTQNKATFPSILQTGILWFNTYLVVVSDHTIKQFDASTGSLVSEWPVPDTNNYASCISLPKHGEFIAYATNQIVSFTR